MVNIETQVGRTAAAGSNCRWDDLCRMSDSSAIPWMHTLFNGRAEECIVLTQLGRRVVYESDGSPEMDIICTWLGPTINVKEMFCLAQSNNACPCFGHGVTIHLINRWAETWNEVDSSAENQLHMLFTSGTK